MKSPRVLLILLLPVFVLLNLGCEQDEDNKIAKAQACMEKVNDAVPAQAQACEAMLGNITTPEAYVIRCSVGFIVGGVTASDIAAAVTASDNASAQLTSATLMGMLAQTNSAQANLTAAYCKLSKVPSLDYLATLSQVGTSINDISPGTDWTNPVQASAAVQACIDTPGSCNDTAVGTAVTSMYSTYCIGEAATNPACSDIGSAIAGGSTPEGIALLLFGFLKN